MRRSLCVLAGLLALTVQLHGQIPRTISYQGVLCDATGKPKPDNTYTMTFRLYEAETGGTEVWKEQKSLSVQRGLFSTLLGPFGAGITFDKPCWLSIQLEGETELSPRVPLSSVGYSFNALRADTATYAANIKDGVVTTTKLSDGAVTGGKVATGQVVKSINTLKDDVTLVAGSNVTITPSGNTLSIAAASGGGGTITEVKSGTGLSGGGTSGSVTLSIANQGVNAEQLADGAVTAGKIADNSIATAKLADNTVTGVKIADGTVATGDIADLAVTTAKLGESAVGTSKLVDEAVTSAKISSGQVVKSINGLKDAVVLAAGSNVTITPSGNTLQIAAAGGGGTITGVQSGTGLTGGGTSGNVTLNVAVPLALTSSSTSSILSGVNTNNGIGTYGESSTYVGVYGKSASLTGVYGTSSGSGTAGVHGENNNGNGVLGVSSGGEGVRGETSAGVGVYGTCNYLGGIGVRGDGIANGPGVYGQNTSTKEGMGVSGHGHIGVRGESDSYVGVVGYSVNGLGVLGASQTAAGVYGTTNDSYGVRGVSANNEGVRGESDGAAAGVHGISASKAGVWGDSPNDAGVLGTGLYGLYGWSGNIAVYCNGAFYQVGGAFEAHPTSTNWSTNKPATVKLSSGAKAKLFAEESAEVFFTDYGEGALINGKAHVELDPQFLQTVTIDAKHAMKVFVQLNDDCRGVFVANRSASGFDVVELQNGNSNARFTYRVVCKRRYYEDERLASEEEDTIYNTRMLQAAWPEVIAQKQQRERQIQEMRQQAASRETKRPILQPSPKRGGVR